MFISDIFTTVFTIKTSPSVSWIIESRTPVSDLGQSSFPSDQCFCCIWLVTIGSDSSRGAQGDYFLLMPILFESLNHAAALPRSIVCLVVVFCYILLEWIDYKYTTSNKIINPSSSKTMLVQMDSPPARLTPAVQTLKSSTLQPELQCSLIQP